ncbi:hypothetical protein XA68_14876 [Ophiocordyceps unilateralis]|uniref:Uncharacterized protein n=1 Tax=Ophiocordyceps unilateralis TaxID=268505 RepID=A0A2A9P9Q1_OPHUN|nr:hypothetical protein XA68_14876 [Ophiocordyceps unilateralis]
MAFSFSSFGSAPSHHHHHHHHRRNRSDRPLHASSSDRRHRSHSSESRSGKRSGSLFGLGNASRGSLFGLGNSSRSSIFGLGASRSSYYRRSPRHGFMQRAYRRLRRMLRDLVRYAKRHPWKVFLVVIMPLVTGGALSALLARFGLRTPPYLERVLGIASHAATADSLGLVSDAVRFAGEFGSAADRHGHRHWDRRWDRSDDGGWVDSIKGFFAKDSYF